MLNNIYYFQINNNKKLSEIGIIDGSILKVDDFLQNYELTVYITNYVPKDITEPQFIVHGNTENLRPIEEMNGITYTMIAMYFYLFIYI